MAYDKIFRIENWIAKNADGLRRAGYTAGELRRVIERETGEKISSPTVRTLADRHQVGLTKKPQNDVGPWIRDRLKSGVDWSDMTARQIADDCGAAIGRHVSTQSVRWWLLQLNVVHRTQRGVGSDAEERLANVAARKSTAAADREQIQRMADRVHVLTIGLNTALQLISAVMDSLARIERHLGTTPLIPIAPEEPATETAGSSNEEFPTPAGWGSI